jgi:CRP-like cAMP-binding protein
MSDLDKAREHKDKGATLFLKGKIEPALKEFQAALALAPDDVAARKKVAESLVKLGRKEPAIAEYQQLAGRYAADGQLAQAIAVGKLILQLDPKHTQTQETLARLYARKTEGSGRWLEKIPPSMAGALNLSHIVAPTPAERPHVFGGPAEIEIDTSALPRPPLFSDLPQDLFLALLKEVQMRTVAPGLPIVREGEAGRSMYVLAQGAVKVVRGLGQKDERAIAEMSEGTFFGEIALLADVPRLASVVAVGECVVLEIEREKLAALTRSHPALEPVLQHFYRERLLANLLRSSVLFSSFDEASRRALIDRFLVRQAKAGEVLIREGARGETLFVLLRGTCDAVHVDAAGKEHTYPPMTEGAFFGEIALLFDQPATATVRATSDCMLLTLDRASFRSHLVANPQAKKLLESFSEQRLQRTAKMLDELGGADAAWV